MVEERHERELLCHVGSSSRQFRKRFRRQWCPTTVVAFHVYAIGVQIYHRGELTASIAHEVNQPLAAVVNNPNACLSLLPKGAPQFDEVRNALTEIVEGCLPS